MKGAFEMSENKWKLGGDMFPEDDILDPITFADVALAVKCNCKVIDEAAVLKTYREIFEQRLEDAEYILKNNLAEIAKAALEMRGH